LQRKTKEKKTAEKEGARHEKYGMPGGLSITGVSKAWKETGIRKEDVR